MVDAFAKGDILQVLFFSVLFGVGLAALGERGKSIIDFFDKLSHVFQNHRLHHARGADRRIHIYDRALLDSIKPLASLMLSVYVTMFLFVFVALNIICKLFGFSLWNYLRFIKDELLIVLGTSSSESVLPRMMDKMERYGCSKSVVLSFRRDILLTWTAPRFICPWRRFSGAGVRR